MNSRMFICCFLAIPLVILTPIQEVLSQSSEDDVKAAFVLNFAKYVQWPTEGKDKLLICVVSEPGEFPSFDQLSAREINEREVAVKTTTSARELGSCSVVYIPASSNAPRAKDLVRSVRGKPVLIVTDGDHDSMIHLFREDNKVRFTIELQTVQDAGLKVGSQLLKLAKSVD